MNGDFAEPGKRTTVKRPYYHEAEKDHFAAIGRVVSEWAYFEFALDAGVLDLAEINHEVGTAIVAQVAGPARKLDAYIALARHLGVKKLNDSLETFAKDTASLAEQRNRIVHDPWMFNLGGRPQRLEATARKRVRLLFVQVSTRQVVQFSFKVTDHIDRFERIHEAVALELQALRETPPASP